MKRHFENELTYLKEAVLELSQEAEQAVREAICAVGGADTENARKIIDNDEQIDQKEIRIEEECLKILALHQPMAGDLRYIIALLKMNNEIERIGDLAVNIAERVLNLAQVKAPEKNVIDFAPMLEESRKMLHNSMKSLVDRDPQLAIEVIQQDDVVDEMHHVNFQKISEELQKSPEYTNFYLSMLSVSRNLERMADCATNICEDVIYLVQGRIVRHCKNWT
jgi:phosphate transport system protein